MASRRFSGAPQLRHRCFVSHPHSGGAGRARWFLHFALDGDPREPLLLVAAPSNFGRAPAP
jgi:hypothetical protein